MSKSPNDIGGVNLPVVPAEPEVVEAFNLNRARAIQDLSQEVDCTLEIEELIAKSRRTLDTLL